MTSQPPTDEPTSGDAVEVEPHGEKVRPITTVYKHPRPILWIYYEGRWHLADVIARQRWPTGAVSYQVELSVPSEPGTYSRISRSFLWGPDSVRPAD